MTRWVRCGSSQKHRKMPGNATKWGEFDNQHVRGIPRKKKKNIKSQVDFNKKAKSLPSTYFSEDSLKKDFSQQDKYCLAENCSLEESHSNISPSKNKADDNKFLTNDIHNPKIKKKRSKFDVKYLSLDGNTGEIDSSKVISRHKKIKLESDCSIVTQDNKKFEQAIDHSDNAENSKFPQESFSLKHNKKKKKYNKTDSESFSVNNGTVEMSLLNHTSFENSDESCSIKQEVVCVTSSDKTIKQVQVFHDIDRFSKKIKLKNDSFIVTQNNKMLEQDNDHSDNAENNKIPEESLSREHSKQKRKKKKRNKTDSESFSVNDGTVETSFLNDISFEKSNESHGIKHSKQKRKKKKHNKTDSESFSVNDETVETPFLNNISFENSDESHGIKQEVECITASDKTIELVQSFPDIDQSSKKQKVKKNFKLNSDSNQSSVNNESCKNSSSKVFKNKKEVHLKKLKKRREELGLIQLPYNVENKLQKIKKRLKEKGFPPEKIKEIMRKERRREELKFRKVFNPQKLCFGCREPGHVLADCPKKSGSLKQETGICFKCGSVEHTSFKCPEKIQGFPYANCFICKEQGHISRHCPQNKHGVYPKGGRCNLCGNVNHLKKDCPTLKKLESKEEDITLPTLKEYASVDAEVLKKEEIKREPHKKSKIVKF